MDDLENLLDLIKSCLLPELKEDLDSIPLEKEHFKSYNDCLRIQLPLLYDWIHQEPTKWLFAVEGSENQKLEIQCHLIILLCELSSPKYLFQLDDDELMSACERILRQFTRLSPQVEQLVFQYYKEKLHKDVWKRQLGAVHGFNKFLEFRYKDATAIMNQQFLMFSLSVGLNVRTCYETHFKYISTCIFDIMLKHGNNENILAMNIHSVIYDAIFKDLHIMDSIPFIEIQWNCLLKCFDYFTDMDSFVWSKLDDAMEVLLRHIPLAPDSQTSVSLLKFVSRLVVYFNLNRNEFEEKFSEDLTHNSIIEEYRQIAGKNTSYTCFRWAKTILQTFILESYRLQQSSQICKEMLLEIHRCYVVTILPIDLGILDFQIENFFEKFTAVLMEAAKNHTYKEDIMRIITAILETFSFQLQLCENTHKFFKFKLSYRNLLEMKEFKSYTSI